MEFINDLIYDERGALVLFIVNHVSDLVCTFEAVPAAKLDSEYSKWDPMGFSMREGCIYGGRSFVSTLSDEMIKRYQRVFSDSKNLSRRAGLIEFFSHGLVQGLEVLANYKEIKTYRGIASPILIPFKNFECGKEALTLSTRYINSKEKAEDIDLIAPNTLEPQQFYFLAPDDWDPTPFKEFVQEEKHDFKVEKKPEPVSAPAVSTPVSTLKTLDFGAGASSQPVEKEPTATTETVTQPEATFEKVIPTWLEGKKIYRCNAGFYSYKIYPGASYLNYLAGEVGILNLVLQSLKKIYGTLIAPSRFEGYWQDLTQSKQPRYSVTFSTTPCDPKILSDVENNLGNPAGIQSLEYPKEILQAMEFACHSISMVKGEDDVNSLYEGTLILYKQYCLELLSIRKYLALSSTEERTRLVVSGGGRYGTRTFESVRR